MAEEKEKTGLGTADRYLAKISKWLGERISAFVAFLFLLFAAGALYGTFIVSRLPQYSPYLLAAPIALALIAYYNRTAAVILFVGLVILFVI